jgi:hypothetical protein
VSAYLFFCLFCDSFFRQPLQISGTVLVKLQKSKLLICYQSFDTLLCSCNLNDILSH